MSMVKLEFNNNQIVRLSDLSFDLSKGAFAIALFPLFDRSLEPLDFFIRIFLGIIAGLAFSYMGLLLLQVKTRK